MEKMCVLYLTKEFSPSKHLFKMACYSHFPPYELHSHLNQSFTAKFSKTKRDVLIKVTGQNKNQ
uniref:Uncharacterized protein n=1 Tax=Arundo donax TaxID=35708 RepID=A0A0A9EWB5_ARUDO